MFDWFFDPHIWASLIALTAMEVVLGIDNVVFISLIVARLPGNVRERARQIGLGLAFVFRVVMLAGITWIIGLTQPLFSVLDQEVSWRDIVLIGGGLFLITKATFEIHHSMEDEEKGSEPTMAMGGAAFLAIIAQIALIDLVFSIDSIITAVGMVEQVEVMIAAVLIAIVIMYAASGPVAAFINRHPTTKMLALSFLFLIGAALIADGIEFHIPRGYIYFAMAFAGLVEVANVFASRRRRRRRSARL